jgi:peptidoglycan/LPS O-acetylase OafA/YrhL
MSVSNPGAFVARRIPELDGLRGIAIWLVLINHISESYGGPVAGDLKLVLRQGWIGVDLFFVLSGFLIGGILIDSRRARNFFQVFYVRRFFRIVPLYWLVFMLSLVSLTGIIPHLGEVRQSDVPWWAFLTFTHNFWMATGRPEMVIFMGVTWSLAVEEQFYLTAPMLVRFLGERWLVWCLAAIIILAPVLRLILYLWLSGDAQRAAAYQLMPCRADALGLGMLAALLLRRSGPWKFFTHNGRMLHIALMLGAIGLVWFLSTNITLTPLLPAAFAYTWIALFFLCMLLIGVTQPKSLLSQLLRTRWLKSTGVIAYGLYMFHSAVGLYLHSLASAHIEQTTIIKAMVDLVAVAATFAVARLSWVFFEKPLLNRGHALAYVFAAPASHEGAATPAHSSGSG